VPLIPVTIISWMNTSMSAVMLRNLMDLASAGIFTAAMTMASTVNIIQAGFNTYWTPYVYEQYQKGETGRFYTVHRLMACLLTGFGLTVTLLQSVVFLLLGPAYRGSVVFFPFLFLAPICYCLGETTDMGIGIMKKTYWSTIVFAISVAMNIALCYALIPGLGASGAAIASAAAAIVALALRTAIGRHYFAAIPDYRYVSYTVGLMLSASVVNYLFNDTAALKYGVLAAVYALALFLFRKEIKTLWHTLLQLLREGKSALRIGGRV
jgi:O-antigen/teichoic acid export membrane protein